LHIFYLNVLVTQVKNLIRKIQNRTKARKNFSKGISEDTIASGSTKSSNST
jgi:hypothetical protein